MVRVGKSCEGSIMEQKQQKPLQKETNP